MLLCPFQAHHRVFAEYQVREAHAECGQLDRLEKIHPPKNWGVAWTGGARKLVRNEHRV
jgi:hypothetical protein